MDRSFVPLGPVGVRVVAATALITLTLVNIAGVRAGKRTNNTLMTAKVGGILVLLALVFSHGTGPASEVALADAAAPSAASIPLLLTALVPILFAYGGWQSCGSLAAEIREPARNLARANVIGVIVVIGLYLSLNVAYLWALTPPEVAASPALAADVARRVAGEAGARFVALLVVISSLGFLGVVIITGPRLYYAMARDGLFFARAGRLHPRYHTPVFALWFQAGVSLVLLTTNTYDELLSYTVFADWLFFGLTAGALFILRRRQPAGPGIFQAPGHPFTTGIFVLVAFGIVTNSFFAFPIQSFIGSGILLLAAGVYTMLHAQVGPMKTPELVVHRVGEGDASGGGQPRPQRDRLLPAVAAAPRPGRPGDAAARPLRVCTAPRGDRRALRVGEDQVFTVSGGTSLANWLACAAALHGAPAANRGDRRAAHLRTAAADPAHARPSCPATREALRRPATSIDLDRFRRLVSRRTRLAIVTNLHNPSGARIDAGTLGTMAAIMARVGGCCWWTRCTSSASSTSARRHAVHAGPNVITTNSLTKAYGLDGLRAGWMLGPRGRDPPGHADPRPAWEQRCRPRGAAHVARVRAAGRNPCPRSIAARAQPGAGPPLLRAGSGGSRRLLPEGGNVVFPRLPAGIDERCCSPRTSSVEYSTLVVPGRFFESPRHIRFSFGMRGAQLARGLRNLSRALDDLGPSRETEMRMRSGGVLTIVRTPPDLILICRRGGGLRSRTVLDFRPAARPSVVTHPVNNEGQENRRAERQPGQPAHRDFPAGSSRRA